MADIEGSNVEHFFEDFDFLFLRDPDFSVPGDAEASINGYAATAWERRQLGGEAVTFEAEIVPGRSRRAWLTYKSDGVRQTERNRSFDAYRCAGALRDAMESFRKYKDGGKG